MAVFTRIPETAMAGVMGVALGAASGTVLSTAYVAISKLKDQINTLQEELEEGNTSGCKNIQSMEKTLNNLDRSLTGIQSSVVSVRNVAATITIAAVSLQAAAAVIKALPIPQQYMVVSFTVLQSDTLELLMEKIAQIGEISAGITGVAAGIGLALSPVQSTIQSLKQSLTTLNVSCALGEETTEQTNGQGSSKDLSTFVAQLNAIISDEVKRIGYLVDLQSGVDNIHTAVVESLIDAVEPGEYVSIPKNTGDWVASVYKVVSTIPERPSSRVVPPHGWVENEPKGDCWVSTATVSGKSGKVSTLWSVPVKYSGSGQTIPENRQYSTLVKKWDYNTIEPVKDKTAITGSILYLKDSKEAYDLLYGILNNLDSEVVSEELKNRVEEVFAPEEGEGEQENVKNVNIGGKMYTLVIKDDPTSPKIAVARFVEAYESGSNNLIITGPSSFTQDNEVLFKNMEITLTQMFM